MLGPGTACFEIPETAFICCLSSSSSFSSCSSFFCICCTSGDCAVCSCARVGASPSSMKHKAVTKEIRSLRQTGYWWEIILAPPWLIVVKQTVPNATASCQLGRQPASHTADIRLNCESLLEEGTGSHNWGNP